MTIQYHEKYYYGDAYSINGDNITLTLKGAVVLTAPLSETKLYAWSIT